MKINLYPPGPVSIPENFTETSKSYRKQVGIASLTLILFIAGYLFFTIWLFYNAYRLFAIAGSGSRDGFMCIVIGLFISFTGVFMIKALFFFKRNRNEGLIEITEAEQPELFNFIYNVADEAKAPRPYKIFLSNRVNASVFYHLSLFNLFFPSRKNLEIGLGLVNTLSLGEFKSILAHEFGHFTQRSMLIGRWVYIAHEVAVQIVARRDALDNFIATLSRLDFRIAWIGWILSVIIWCIRSIAETFFRLVIFTQQALSREMEFHADLVAVSLTGSDAIINSLSRLNPADEAFDNSLEFLNKQIEKGKAVKDFYVLQTNYLKKMAFLLDNPTYGESPIIPEENGAKYRVFKQEIANPPKMWMSHPPSSDREENAKRIYIKAAIDSRSTWCLINNSEKVRERLTAEMLKTVEKKVELMNNEEAISEQNKDFEHIFLDPEYKGMYLYRRLFASYISIDEVYSETIDFDMNYVDVLYPGSLKDQLERLKTLTEELNLLEGLYSNALSVQDGKVRYRGKELNKKVFPDLIAEVKRDIEEEEKKINEQDRKIHTFHYGLAEKIGKGWDSYLKSLAKLLHYCEHRLERTEIQSKRFYEVLIDISSKGNVGVWDIQGLLKEAKGLYAVLKNSYVQGKEIILNEILIRKLDGKDFSEIIGSFDLLDPTEDNISEWTEKVGPWIYKAGESLNMLRIVVLNEFLLSELEIRQTFYSKKEIGTPPQLVEAPELNAIVEQGETYRKKQDWFEKIYSSDGIVPTTIRLAVTGALICTGIFLAGSIGESDLIMYNGLPVDVIVYVNNQKQLIPHESFVDIVLEKNTDLHIKTETLDGTFIEEFDEYDLNTTSNYVYNIANATYMYGWTSYYVASDVKNAPLPFGVVRFFKCNADYYFVEPSSPADDKNSIVVLSALVGMNPANIVAQISDSVQLKNFVRAHARWEKADSKYIIQWLSMAANDTEINTILKERLRENPLEVVSLRRMQNLPWNDKREICEYQNAIYEKNKENPDMYYVHVRCMKEGTGQDSAFCQGHKKWPENPWLAAAAGYILTQEEKWEEALSCYETAYRNSMALRLTLEEEMARLTRFLKKDYASNMNWDIVASPFLGYVAAVEKSQPYESNNNLYAFKLLEQGKINDALEYSKTDTMLYPYILRLAAASDGIQQDSIINLVMRLPIKMGLNSASLFSTVALYTKRNMRLDPILPNLKVYGGEATDSLLKFFELVKNKKIKEAEQLLLQMPMDPKGKCALFGILILDGEVPERWKKYAADLLFINEKPYLRVLQKENG